jgi:DNA-binding transcriptional ArsR family regulator
VAYARAIVALGNLTRCLIFERLRGGPASVGQIAAGIPVSRPAVSQHLKALKKAGLVCDWVMGARHMYQVDERGLGELRAWLDRFPGEAQSATKAKGKRRARPQGTKGGRRVV